MMLKETKIHIYNSIEYIPICSAALKECAAILGFRRREIHKMVLVIEEVLGQIIKCFHIEGQENEIIIHFQQIQNGLRIKINDFGIPMDAEKIQSCDDNDPQGFGMARAILHKYMDVVSFEAKGYEGNETIFEKHFHSKKRQVALEEAVLMAKEESQIGRPEDITVRLLMEEEASAVSKLAYIAYHYSHPYELIYIPKKIKEKIKSKKMYSAIGVLEGDKIISHTALVLPEQGAKTGEIGIAFTDPHYRGYGCMSKLWTFLIDDIAKELGLFGVFAMAVCSHPFSQKACHRMNLLDTALLVSQAPVLDFEDIDVQEQQRESIMMAFRILEQVENVVFYMPKHHKKMILEISSQLGLSVKTGNHPFLHIESHHSYSNIEVTSNEVFKTADIIVNHVGRDLKRVFEKEFQNLKTARNESIYLFLDLADYHTEKYTSYFEKLGFFFAGIMHQENRMNLVLQYLNNQDYHFSSLKIDSEFGQKLTKYVENEYLKRLF